jgi:hypothetical protein
MKKIFTPVIKKAMLVAFVTTQAALLANAQADISAKFSKYQENALQEKVFVHTDKTTYLTGEILWIKVYVTDGITNQPSGLSKVAYVDVLDNNQAPVLQAKIALKNGSGNGSIYLPVSVSSGNYQLRAYTNWMKNFSPDYYFNKALTIINPLKSPDEPAAAGTPAVVDVQFFPEGGNMVRGITSKVGFKMTGTDGHSANYSGVIINQRNDTVVKFKPLRFGMGNFSFTPAVNTNYRAIIKAGNGRDVIKELPAIQEQGYVMLATEVDNNKIEISVKSNAQSNGPVYLFAHTRQVAKITETAELNYGDAHFVIDKNKLGDGISHITLFNNAKQSVAERLVFKQPTQKLLLDATTDQEQYNGRKKVSVNLSAKTSSGQAVASDLSMAVYRLDSLQKSDESSILSYIWLASDLRGRIDSADYYFKNPTTETNQALTNLLLTQGWRRFEWNNVLKDQPAAFKFLPETDGHLITGKVVNTLTNGPANDILVHMGVPGTRLQYYNAKSNANGDILFNTTDYYGSTEIVLQTDRQKDSTYTLSINNPFSESYGTYRIPAFNLNKNMLKPLQQLSVSMQAQNIYNGKKQNQFYDPGIDSAAFYYKPKYFFKLDDYTRFTTMEEVFREYITSANVAKRTGRFHLHIFNGLENLEGDPLVFIDGVPMLDLDKLFLIDPLKIKSIDVTPFRYFYGSAILTGVVNLKSYKSDLAGYEIDPHAAIVDYEGMQLQREFYTPVYDTEQQANSTMPDFRSVLYWQPNAGTDESGKKAISFYTSDLNGRYIGVVQGNSASGAVGSASFTFEVKNGAL